MKVRQIDAVIVSRIKERGTATVERGLAGHEIKAEQSDLRTIMSWQCLPRVCGGWRRRTEPCLALG